MKVKFYLANSDKGRGKHIPQVLLLQLLSPNYWVLRLMNELLKATLC